MLSILPSYIVAIKLVLTFVLILLAIPLLSRLTTNTPSDALLGLMNKRYETKPQTFDAHNNWRSSILWVSRSYLHNFLYLLKIALPFMVLAGLLGALLITAIPADTLRHIQVEGYMAKTAVLACISLLAALLPVPMTFDIVLATNLHLLGVEARYISALLFGLGTFSIYPYLILRRYMGKRLANAMMLTVVAFSFVAGFAAHYLASPYEQWQQQQFQTKVVNTAKPLTVIERSAERTITKPVALPQQPATTISNNNGIKVSHRPFNKKDASLKPHQFKRYIGDTVGLNTSYQASLELFTDIGLFKGIASGDINADGWDDILVNDSSGLRLFINTGHLTFTEAATDSYKPSSHFTTAAALADINNDGLLDIVYTVAYEGLFYLENSHGTFNTPAQFIPNLPAATISPDIAFSDIDRDGDLDILVSNWTTGSFSDSFNLDDASNAILINNKGSFTLKKMTCAPGETLSMLATDFNQDHWPDLIVANDFLPDDCFYRGSTENLNSTSSKAVGFNLNPIHSMSYDSGDINNDGLLDYFATDISDPYDDSVIPLKSDSSCDDFKHTQHFSACIETKQIRSAVTQKHEYLSCVGLSNKAYAQECQAYVYFLQIMGNQTDCAGIPKAWPLLARTCEDAQKAQLSATGLLPHIDFNGQRGNTLHRQNADGSFTNIEKQWQVQHTGWSWNARFADINNDTWQDLFIVNGYPMQAYDESNLLLLNQQGKSFDNATAKLGLADFHITMNYSYSDLDNDGDLDIVTHSPYGPMNMWINQLPQGNAIKVSLVDKRGNYYGVGAKVKIHYGNNKVQLREMKLSGGFGSNDAPYLHFGLAQHDNISLIEIHWITGKVNYVKGSLPVNKHYIIERPSQ